MVKRKEKKHRELSVRQDVVSVGGSDHCGPKDS